MLGWICIGDDMAHIDKEQELISMLKRAKGNISKPKLSMNGKFSNNKIINIYKNNNVSKGALFDPRFICDWKILNQIMALIKQCYFYKCLLFLTNFGKIILFH